MRPAKVLTASASSMCGNLKRQPDGSATSSPRICKAQASPRRRRCTKRTPSSRPELDALGAPRERAAESIRRTARERLGFERLRPGQLAAITAATAGRDVLAVLPTGAGKSTIYELAGLLQAGPTVVVSPLIALQEDQLAHLRNAGLSATVLNSKQSARARTEALAALGGADECVFVSPAAHQS